jgi:hypothetical protein
MGSSSLPADTPRVHGEARRQQAPRGSSDRERRVARRPESHGGGGRRGGDRGKQPNPRAQSPKQQVPRSPAKPGPSKTGAVSTRNPYDMSIEERMKYYREKYGQGLSAERSGGAQRRSHKRPAAEGKGALQSPHNTPSRVPSGSGSRSIPPKSKPEGLFGRLLGGFKKKNK